MAAGECGAKKGEIESMRFKRHSRTGMVQRVGVVLAFALAAAPCVAPAGQQDSTNRWTQRSPNGNPFDEDSPTDPVLAARQIRALNAERQKSLVSDTNKLLALAKELRAEIEDPKAEAPTPVQMRKVAEIEKLARNVKQKMSFSVEGTPSYHAPTLQPIR